MSKKGRPKGQGGSAKLNIEDPGSPPPARADEVTDEMMLRAGRLALRLMRQTGWMHRRVERVTFNDDVSVRHSVSVDFALPRDLPVAWTDDGKEVYAVPLFLVRKDQGKSPKRTPEDEPMRVASYTNVDFVDQHNNGLPLPTGAECRDIANMTLLAQARKLIGPAALDALKDDISGIAITDNVHGHPCLDRILDTEAGEDDPRRKLQQDPLFCELAHAFVSHLFIVHLQFGRPSGRTVIKLAYDEPTRRRRLSIEEELRRSLGWKAARLHVQLNEIGAAASYHVEIVVPPELELTEVGLFAERYKYGWNGLPPVRSRWQRLKKSLRRERTDPRDREGFLVRQVQRTSSGHIYIPNPEGRRVGAAWVKLRARRRGFLLNALVTSIITSAVLFWYAYHARQFAVSDSSDAATAALLLVPTLLVAYIATPGEHAITIRMLRWARLALVANGTLPFFAAMRLLSVSDQDPHPTKTLEGTWMPLAWGSLVFVVMFIMSNVFPRPHGLSRYAVRHNGLKGQSAA